MAKQSILGRISQLLRANINALLDQAEDPQMMLDQLVRDYTNSIAEAESAVAQTIGNLRLMEQDHAEDVEAAADWGRKALAASAKGDELRAAGKAEDADKFDKLAKMAIGKQITAENEAKNAEPTIASQNDVVEKLKYGLEGMRGKLGELTSKRDELVARAKTARGAEPGRRLAAEHRRLDPTSELGRFEEKVRREEALVAGKQEIAASTLDSQFESLEELDKATEVEARLVELKATTGGSPQAITSGE